MVMYDPGRPDTGCGEVPLMEKSKPKEEETCEAGDRLTTVSTQTIRGEQQDMGGGRSKMP